MPGFNIPSHPGCDQAQPGSSYRSDTAAVSNTIETARANRFWLSITSPSYLLYNQDNRMLCKYIDRPSVRIQEERVYNGMDYINVPLRYELYPVELSLYEQIEDLSNGQTMTAKFLYHWWSMVVTDYRASSGAVPSEYHATATIGMIDGQGNDVWQYRLHGCWPSFINPDRVDNTSSNILETKVTLLYNKLEQMSPSSFTRFTRTT